MAINTACTWKCHLPFELLVVFLKLLSTVVIKYSLTVVKEWVDIYFARVKSSFGIGWHLKFPKEDTMVDKSPKKLLPSGKIFDCAVAIRSSTVELMFTLTSLVPPPFFSRTDTCVFLFVKVQPAFQKMR